MAGSPERGRKYLHGENKSKKYSTWHELLTWLEEYVAGSRISCVAGSTYGAGRHTGQEVRYEVGSARSSKCTGHGRQYDIL
jgi:hypothetical protein